MFRIRKFCCCSVKKVKAMQTRNSLLPRPLYVAFSILVAIATLWIGAHAVGFVRDSQAHDAKWAGLRIPQAIARSKSDVIVHTALKDRDYTPDDYGRDMAQINYLAACAGMSLRERQETLISHMEEAAAKRYSAELTTVPVIGRRSTISSLLMPQLQLAHDKYYIPTPGGMDPLRAVLQLVGLGVFFSFGAMVILMLRVLTHSQRIGQALSIYQSDWREIIGAGFIWAQGLSDEGYNPLSNWENRVRIRMYDADQTDRAEAELALMLEAEQMLPKREALIALLKRIWGAFNWRQALPSLKTYEGRTHIRRELTTCMYLSAIAVIYINCGYKLAYADETKEEQPISSAILVTNADLRGVNEPSSHLFIFGRKGSTATLLGFSGPDPQLELVQPVWRMNLHDERKSFYGEAGPFADIALTNSGNRLRAYGLSAFFTGTIGRVKFGGPVYAARDTQGQSHLWMPGTWALYRLTPKLSLGLGSSLFATAGGSYAANLGPVVDYAIDKFTTARARYTNGGFGGFAGTGPSLRFDLIKRF